MKKGYLFTVVSKGDNRMNASQTKQLDITPPIRSYLEGLLKDSGMELVDELMHEQMISELFVRLDQYLTAVIIEHMPSDHLEAFVQLHEDHKPQSEIEHYITTHLPDAKEVLTTAFIDFREEYLGSTTLARNLPTSGNEAPKN